MKAEIEGGEPLIGRVRVSGSKNSALKLIAGALFSNEDVVLENVPRVSSILSDLEVLKSLGVSFSWEALGKLKINAKDLNLSEIPLESNSRYRTLALLTGPLLYRFGRARIPKPRSELFLTSPINRWLETWDSLGFSILESTNFYDIESKRSQSSEINFKLNTVMGTENAILSSVFIPGTTTINNAAAEPEVDDLVAFLNALGGNVKRVEERKIIINGMATFEGTKYTVMPDRSEVVALSIAALLTNGDLEIQGSTSSDLLPFVRKLEAVKANFEFKGDVLRIWKHKNDVLEAVTVETSPFPGFTTDWQPLMTVLLTQAKGTSFIHETIYTDRLLYTKDLNRMGAKITLLKPSEVGLQPVISEDSYDFEKLGEPFTVAKIEGSTPLRRERINVSDPRFSIALILASLCANGVSEVHSFEAVNDLFENFSEKLKALGAKIKIIS
ncbi:MAG: UDP-N-acetylglucosamine 1-carboxyvinyltransferase [Patescibacteria group bacterium]